MHSSVLGRRMVTELGRFVGRASATQPVKQVLLRVIPQVALLFTRAGAPGRWIDRASAASESSTGALASHLLHRHVG